MTADITQDRIAELRGQHTPSVVYHDKKVCPKCSYEEYPCTMLALLDALEAERGLHALDHSLADRRERERDQLRAENERLKGILDNDWNEENDRLRERVTALQGENERLRAALIESLHELGNHWTKFGVPTERWQALKDWGDEPIHDDAERQWVLAWRAFTRGKAALAASPEQEGQ